MTKCKCENLLALIFIILCSSGIACGQDEPPQPPNKTPSFRILQIVDVQQDLELSLEQIKKIKVIEREMLSGINQLRSESEGTGNGTLPGVKVADAFKSKIADAERVINEEVLFDFQTKRLKQIQWRIELNRIGIDRILKDNSVSTFLGMTEKEKKDFFKKASEEKIRTIKEIEKLRFEMEQNILSLVPKTCQDNFDKLLGKEFQIKRSSWRQQKKP